MGCCTCVLSHQNKEIYRLCVYFTTGSDNEITRRGNTALGYQSTLTRAESITQLQSENGHYSSKINYKTITTSVLEGREDVNTSVDPEPSSAASTTTPCDREQLDLDGPGAQQDSDVVDDEDLSSLNSSLRLNDQLLTSQVSVNEECESVGEANYTSVEEAHQEDDVIVTGLPEQCQETDNEITQHAVYAIPQKTSKQVASHNIDRYHFSQHLLLRSFYQ